MKDVTGKVAFITGGASGVGLGMAKVFLDAGMKVMAADISEAHIESAKSLMGERDDLCFLQLDITDRQAMAEAAKTTIKTFGKIHILCNNAGIGLMANAKEASYADWDWSLAVNLTSIFNGIHIFLPYILEQGEGGHIVNTGSVSSVLPSNIVYGAAKTAVLGLSEALCTELLEDNIGVTCLMPGPIKSNIHKVAELRPSEYSDTRLHEQEKELAQREPRDGWLDPLLAGDLVLDAIKRNILFVFTHAEQKDGTAKRFDAILAAFPEGEVNEHSAEKLGFRIANPLYEDILLAAEPPARHRDSS